MINELVGVPEEALCIHFILVTLVGWTVAFEVDMFPESSMMVVVLVAAFALELFVPALYALKTRDGFMAGV